MRRFSPTARPTARAPARVIAAALALVIGGLIGPAPWPARAQATADGANLADNLSTLPALLNALGGDVITFTAANAEAHVATLVAAPPAAVEAVLRTPAAYLQAIPSLARADVVERRPRPGGGEDLLVDWELEIPLFNLRGKLWVGGDGPRVVMDLVEGNFAPGQLVFTWAPAGSGQTIVALRARVNNQEGGWVIKRVASHSRYAGPAINAAAAYVAARAMAALAEHPRDAGARRPHAPPSPPTLAAINGRPLAERLLAADGAGTAALGLVRRASSGRLAMVSIAVPTRRAADGAAAALGAPESWRAFPGWKHVDRVPAAPDGNGFVDVDVRDNVPFVDFDARWRLWPGPPPRAQATSGSGHGAVFGWDLVDTAPPRLPATAAVLSLYPRLEALGYVPRKFIAAEPLLEHGLALALAYADAMAARDALDATAAAPVDQKRQ
ncbi:MAG TPA: hypothetical protein VH374_17705 [Polyangia bacterium]|jgi:hypothetical protein|nr:hypothetical protein [Polyangia bacterium]